MGRSGRSFAGAGIDLPAVGQLDPFQVGPQLLARHTGCLLDVRATVWRYRARAGAPLGNCRRRNPQGSGQGRYAPCAVNCCRYGCHGPASVGIAYSPVNRHCLYRLRAWSY